MGMAREGAWGPDIMLGLGFLEHGVRDGNDCKTHNFPQWRPHITRTQLENGLTAWFHTSAIACDVRMYHMLAGASKGEENRV